MTSVEAADNTNNNEEGSRVPPTAARRERRPCKFYATRRGCSLGLDCKFSHDPEGDGEREAPVVARERAKSHKTNRVPVCRQYQSSGGCRYGDKCRYRHVIRAERESGAECEGVRREEGEREVKESAVLDLTNFPAPNTTGEKDDG